jgi:Mg-chelatase subunit ChlD
MKRLTSTLLLGWLSLASLHAHEQLAPEVAAEAPRRPQVEVAFVLDTTGSMSGLIEGAKQKIWSIANEIASANDNPEVKFGLIGYRDRGDEYITKTYDLTGDLDTIYLRLMEFRAGGGGDSPESVNQALHESVNQLSWSDDADTLRLIFLVGDAPPHMDYQDDVKYDQSCDLARSKDIIINTIQCGNMSGTAEIWGAIASAAQGEYVAIEQAGGMHAIETPLDPKISELNQAMAGTVITYGDARAQSVGKSKVANALAASPEAAASRYDYFSKSSADPDAAPVAISGNEDLVAQFANDEIEVEEIENDLLPKVLQALEGAELNAHITEMAATRKAIQTELNQVLKERQVYVDQERTKREAEGKSGGFDDQVKALIRKQGASKGIGY